MVRSDICENDALWPQSAVRCAANRNAKNCGQELLLIPLASSTVVFFLFVYIAVRFWSAGRELCSRLGVGVVGGMSACPDGVPLSRKCRGATSGM